MPRPAAGDWTAYGGSCASHLGIDAVIIADPGVLEYARQVPSADAATPRQPYRPPVTRRSTSPSALWHPVLPIVLDAGTGRTRYPQHRGSRSKCSASAASVRNERRPLLVVLVATGIAHHRRLSAGRSSQGEEADAMDVRPRILIDRYGNDENAGYLHDLQGRLRSLATITP